MIRRSYRTVLFLCHRGKAGVLNTHQKCLLKKPTASRLPAALFTSSGNPLQSSLKTHTCGELGREQVGEQVTLRGHLQYQRLAKFAVLRDAYGKTQVLLRDQDSELQRILKDTPYESYVEIKGTVSLRPKGMQNEAMVTGEVEVVADSLQVLSRASPNLPFIIRDYHKPNEQLRLKHRYLDLRHSEMQNNLRLKSQVAKKMRDYLQDTEGFVELTTPTLSVNTPGGAQEFVVPTRHRGQFYSLVQSPQTYKQLAVIGGIDRYFQFAVCYRDEGGKPDRQPEFLQVDIEMADVTMKDVQTLVEKLLVHAWPAHLPPISTPFPHLSYQEALTSYGVDKPDTRFGWKLHNITDIVQGCGALTLENEVSHPGSAAYAFVIPGGQAHVGRAVVAEWEEVAQREHRMPGVVTLAVQAGLTFKGPLAKRMKSDTHTQLCTVLQAQPGDLLVLAAGPTHSLLGLLGKLRLLAAKTLEEAGIRVREPGLFNFLWVENFPLFEHDAEGRISSVHHPFTLPLHQDTHYLYSDPLQAQSQHYDLVLNGCEVGGGSLRVFDPEMQRYILQDILGLEAASLGFLSEALQCGAPPHGGIALGFDRLLAELCGTSSIREVIAFPKTMEGRCLMSGAPGTITQQEEQLYHISVSKESVEKSD